MICLLPPQRRRRRLRQPPNVIEIPKTSRNADDQSLYVETVIYYLRRDCYAEFHFNYKTNRSGSAAFFETPRANVTVSPAVAVATRYVWYASSRITDGFSPGLWTILRFVLRASRIHGTQVIVTVRTTQTVSGPNLNSDKIRTLRFCTRLNSIRRVVIGRRLTVNKCTCSYASKTMNVFI